ncbi:putative coatomer subunit beta'-3 [Triticum dicoccoides]|uniref:putative coatomer subunit beta'-3 n=1 Tax=Triticum dicoccoides TaxID=85692 RepID=UPI00188F5D49|nr:putative coatomer subunit beta'-3 [Triticum dicoccoides]
MNCADYFTSGDRPFLITGSDDQTAKVWDYQTKSCVQTLEGHAHNVSVVCFHPELPTIITGSEDGTVRLWYSTTYRKRSASHTTYDVVIPLPSRTAM